MQEISGIVRVNKVVSYGTYGTSVCVIYNSLMGKTNVADVTICIQAPRVNPYPNDVTIKTHETTSTQVMEHGIHWRRKEDFGDRKNSINYILQTQLSIADDNSSTGSWTGTRNPTAPPRGWAASRIWTKSNDCAGTNECGRFKEWGAGSNYWISESKDWTSSSDTEAKGNSFIDPLQTLPTSEDDEEVQGLLCLLHHPKAINLTSDIERIDGHLTTEAETVCEISALRDLANEDNSIRQMVTQRPELDFRKMQVTESFFENQIIISYRNLMHV